MRFPDPRDPRSYPPDLEMAGLEGALGFANDLSVETLREAYRRGIFPWPVEGLPLPWFCPPRRGVIDFKDLHLPRSLRAFLKKNPFRVTHDRDFAAVIRACAKVKRAGQRGTWISAPMIEAYTRLHAAGDARSVEVWRDTPTGERLVGGLYGVLSPAVFAGESMFHLEPEASKVALLATIERLRGEGFGWMDIQMVTPHMEALGAREISRDEFLDRIKLDT